MLLKLRGLFHTGCTSRYDCAPVEINECFLTWSATHSLARTYSYCMTSGVKPWFPLFTRTSCCQRAPRRLSDLSASGAPCLTCFASQIRRPETTVDPGADLRDGVDHRRHDHLLGAHRRPRHRLQHGELPETRGQGRQGQSGGATGSRVKDHGPMGRLFRCETSHCRVSILEG